MKVEVEIPFSGFYESMHDQWLEDAIENAFNYDYETGETIELGDEYEKARCDADIDWTKIHRDYAKAYAEAFGEEFDLDVEFVDMTSPRFYNYSTDRIFVNIPVEQMNKIRREVEADEGWAERIRELYTDRSGFWSNFSNDSKDEDWTREELQPVQYLTILNYWIEKLSDASEDWEVFLMEDFRCNGGIDEIVSDAVNLIEKEVEKSK